MNTSRVKKRREKIYRYTFIQKQRHRKQKMQQSLLPSMADNADLFYLFLFYLDLRWVCHSLFLYKPGHFTLWCKISG